MTCRHFAGQAIRRLEKKGDLKRGHSSSCSPDLIAEATVNLFVSFNGALFGFEPARIEEAHTWALDHLGVNGLTQSGQPAPPHGALAAGGA